MSLLGRERKKFCLLLWSNDFRHHHEWLFFSFWNIIWVIWSPQSWDHNEKYHWLTPHQWSSANHFYLKCKWMKNIWEKLTHRWLKAYGWMPKEDHLHVLYSKTLASRAFPPAVMHGGWRPSTGGTSSWNTSMEDTCVIQYCQEWLKATVQSLLWTRAGGKGDRRVALDLWGLPFSCSISA